MPEGSITLSFDCEGKWGMTDIHTPWDENLTRSSLLSAYDFILQTLEKYDIRATFGFVGALTVTREEFLEVSYPNLFSASYASWLGPSRDRILKKSEEGWFLPELLDMVKGQQKHEIASHGYTHIPFSLLSEPDVQLELGMVLSWAEKKNIDCSTFIFPRNLVYHQNILKDFGIFGYRDTPISVFGTGVPKYLRTLAEEIWIFQKSEKLKEGTARTLIKHSRSIIILISDNITLGKISLILTSRAFVICRSTGSMSILTSSYSEDTTTADKFLE